ncbi:hypothetical protein [Deferribacter autotrophicus]|uniref:hypothetical protein n=1 Tax=Deferribacter autotrophicus TaxID=500465 RepID=UPI00165E6999|nr:hypothetical protein [Deferribacter autotrophicus]
MDKKFLKLHWSNRLVKLSISTKIVLKLLKVEVKAKAKGNRKLLMMNFELR